MGGYIGRVLPVFRHNFYSIDENRVMKNSVLAYSTTGINKNNVTAKSNLFHRYPLFGVQLLQWPLSRDRKMIEKFE